MGKSKKELKRFESVAFIALEALDKAIKMKSLQIEELKMKQNHEKEMAILNKKPLNTAEKFPSGGLVESKGEGEILIPKWLRDFDLKKDEIINREELVSRGEKIASFIFQNYGKENCDCPICVAERYLNNNGKG